MSPSPEGESPRVAPDIPASEAAEVLDARGKIVTPGLVDIHAHLDADMPPAHCLSTGVTAIVDAGSRGADNVGELVTLAKAAPNRDADPAEPRPHRAGQHAASCSTSPMRMWPRRGAPIDANRDVIIGIKARLSKRSPATHDLDAIDRAHEVTVPLGLPLMVHIGQTASPVPALLGRLRPGDIVTHVYAPPPNTILDERRTCVSGSPRGAEARASCSTSATAAAATLRGRWPTARLQQGFLPDTISSDLTAPGRTDRVFDFPTVLSKFLLLGLSLDQVIASATVNAARAIAPFRDLGTLARRRACRCERLRAARRASSSSWTTSARSEWAGRSWRHSPSSCLANESIEPSKGRHETTRHTNLFATL